MQGAWAPLSQADEIRIEDINVVAGRTRTFGDTVRNAEIPLLSKNMLALTVDGVITEIPGASLFRRSDSLSAHPTIQGLSLLPIGGNGAGRALVTLDGLPLNDPFGGWVYWSALDASALNRATVSTGKSGGSFASYSLTGRVDIHSFGDLKGLHVDASVGSFDSQSISVRGGVGLSDQLTLAGRASYRKTDGFHQFPVDQRGPIDQRLASDQTTVNGSLSYDDSEGVAAYLGLTYFKENRLNGYLTAPNSTVMWDSVFRTSVDKGDWGVELLAWYKDRDFDNSFTAARDDRTVERHVLDQFSVPSWSTGGSLRYQQEGLEAGIDYNRMSGSVNENYRNLGAGFTRLRQAGGDQQIMGAFVDVHTQIGQSDFHVEANGRLDHYRIDNGFRRESALSDQAVLRNEIYASKQGVIPTGGISLGYSVNATEISLGFSHSWRLPTLNEFYRPFRVGNDITEANSALRPEKLNNLSLSVFTDFDHVNASITLRHVTVKDAVGNVTIGFGPGFFPLGGFVPAGGVLRQRTNIDQTTSNMAEFSLSSYVTEGLLLSATYLYTDAEISAFAASPELVGRRPVQTPRHSVTSELTYEGDAFGTDVWGTLQGRYLGGQYEDDLNQRLLPDAFLVSAMVGAEITDGVVLTLRANNIFDQKLVSGLSADGLETIAQRRQVMVNLSYQF